MTEEQNQVPVFFSLDGSNTKKPNDPIVGTMSNIRIEGNRIIGELNFNDTNDAKAIEETIRIGNIISISQKLPDDFYSNIIRFGTPFDLRTEDQKKKMEDYYNNLEISQREPEGNFPKRIMLPDMEAVIDSMHDKLFRELTKGHEKNES